jgi:predicted AAA+ superfamily ATPase
LDAADVLTPRCQPSPSQENLQDQLFWGNDRLEAALAWATRRGEGSGRAGVQAHQFVAP